MFRRPYMPLARSAYEPSLGTLKPGSADRHVDWPSVAVYFPASHFVCAKPSPADGPVRKSTI